jgi:hypothetical protein
VVLGIEDLVAAAATFGVPSIIVSAKAWAAPSRGRGSGPGALAPPTFDVTCSGEINFSA